MEDSRFLRKMYFAVLISVCVLALNAVNAATTTTSHDSNAVLARMSAKFTQAEREAAAARFAQLKAQAPAPMQAKKMKSLAAKPSFAAGGTPLPSAGTTPHYFGPYPNWAYTPIIRKFVDSLPGLGAANKNNLNEYIPLAVADVATYPGCDYYEIGLVEYTQQMHSDLPPTKLRGYVQLNDPANPVTRDGSGNITAWPQPHYLGPMIVATKDTPVRVKFVNLLPKGAGGDLFIPCDTTEMGAGMGPNPMIMPNSAVRVGGVGTTIEVTTPTAHGFAVGTLLMLDGFTPAGYNGQFRVTAVPSATTFRIVLTADPGSDATMAGNVMELYTQNRGTLHLHGGLTPWISDGTPHQWITPAGETTGYPKGVSVSNVPDMTNPGDGSMTFFYSNQQSARLMFYHDHAFGITRLNVYSGEAAGYILRDSTEQSLINAGTIPSDEIPLIIQDKTFVDANTIASTDPTWNWGSSPGSAVQGDLWYPHVYMPNQNPYDMSGANPYGRWDYGPWFWPIWPVSIGEVANPYYDPINAPWEPPYNPGVPNNSMTMEAFHDTPVINGTAYPYLEVQPKAYRFRILNASNDRFWNLMLVQADPSITVGTAGNTEVKMVDFFPNVVWPAGWGMPDARVGGVPDPTLLGPSMIQIGTEGGFLPEPVIWPNIPVDYEYDRRNVVVLNVKEHNLFLGCAERADVIIDFSAYAGKTLILYNDSPAPVPAGDPRLDYYTGDADNTATGGTATTVAGFGPNTRTLMQIRVANVAPAAAYDVAALQTAFATNGATQGVFAKSQNPILVPQAGYNSAYNATFPADTTAYERIQSNTLTFKPLDLTQPSKMSLANLTITNNPKAIAEEFESTYGRMSGFLGVEMPFTNGQNQTTIWYDYYDPATENLTDSITPLAPAAGDGTQIWKVTHNGVDTHPVHFHLFDVQLINRIGWDGAVKPPEKNELGWKETVRMNPLEDCVVALRPVAPQLPFGIPVSQRPLDPTMPLHTTTQFKGVDPLTGNPVAVSNEITNFGWEYVWHCHILSHEEMDMMRPMVFNVTTTLPDAPVLTCNGLTTQVDLSWTDGTVPGAPGTLGNPKNEIGYRVERADVVGGVPGAYSVIGAALANETTYSDTTIAGGAEYSYRVTAFNATGDSASNEVQVSYVGVPVAPSSLVVSLTTLTSVDLTWTDNANNETSFTVQRATDNAFTLNVTNYTINSANVTTYTNNAGVVTGTTYYYRVRASNGNGSSTWSNTASIIAAAPTDPTTLTATASAATANPLTVTLDWTDTSTIETGFKVDRATDSAFTLNVTSVTVSAKAGTGAASYVDNTVAANTTYYYRVSALNGAVASGFTNTASASTVPAAPSSLVAALQTLTSINLTWVDNGNTETGFTIQRATDSGFTTGVITYSVAANSTSYLNNSVIVLNATYYYRIKAFNATGDSAWSNTSSVVVGSPKAPSAPTATASAATANPLTITIGWKDNATNEAGFTIQRATNTAFTINLTTFTAPAKAGTGATSYVDNTVAANTTYYYRVRAFNGALVTAWTGRVSASTVPAAPSGLTGTLASIKSVTLNWTDNGLTETGFTVQRATDNLFTTGLVTYTINKANTVTYANSSAVVAGTTYYYRVRAFNATGSSAWSNVVSVTAAIPGAPTTLTAIPSASTAVPLTVTLNWTDTATVEKGFTIQRATNSGFSKNLTTFTAPAKAGTGGASYVDNTAVLNTTYYYRVRAFNGAVVSAWSNTITAIVH